MHCTDINIRNYGELARALKVEHHLIPRDDFIMKRICYCICTTVTTMMEYKLGAA